MSRGPHRDPGPGHPSTAALTWLFLLAGLLGFVSLAVPHDPATAEIPLAVASAASFVAAAISRWAGRWAINPLLVVATILVSLAILFTAGVPNASTALYLWICLYGAYSLPRRVSLAQTTFVTLSYGAVIAIDPPPFPPVAGATTTIGAFYGVTLLVSLMRSRLNEVIARLAAAASTDPLTGLLNRRAFSERLEAEIERSKRTGRPFSLLLGDLDRFKLVNDLLGHSAGDEVLKGFARILSSIRRIDITARLGGEEFAIVLPETSSAAAMVVAERLRHEVTSRLSSDELRLTVSFGVVTYPEDGPTPEALLHHADRALYAAKRRGRDRAVAYDPDDTERAFAVPPSDGEEVRGRALVLLAESIDLRDPSTAAHSRTVGAYAAEIARRLGFDELHIARVRLAGVLHDIGKLAVPDTLLLHPGALTPAQHAILRRHPELGARLLEGAGLDEKARWIRAHHERVDGTGYPDGLAGAEIPLEARILAVADAFEAMTANRPYRSAMSVEDARAELLAHNGTQFDPEVVDALLAVLDQTADEFPAFA